MSYQLTRNNTIHQVLQNIRNGKLSVARIPVPVAGPGEVLVANEASVISAGTEKMVMELSRKSLMGKARERPDHVRRVLEKVRQEGVVQTVRQVREKLDEPMAMGYSSAGTVLACGHDVQQFKVGDRVASNGPHASVVRVPKHLCAHVPDGVAMEQAAFGVLGAIAMQGVRLSKASLGENALVIGLGLVGQLTVALLNAAGCRVIATDPDESKCELALAMGADVARPGLNAAAAAELTGQHGADVVIIAASTNSNGPIHLAADAVRPKGRVVLVGVVGLELDRRPFYFKEAEFVVSCSYGPGRYDAAYEQSGHDYPYAYVRWTEQRNLQSVLDLMGQGRLDVRPLISHRYGIEQAEAAYQLIETGEHPYIGIVLQYPPVKEPPVRRIELRSSAPADGKIGYAMLGCGNFARMVLLPAIQKTEGLHPVLLCSAGGLSASHTARNLGFEAVTTDAADVLREPRVSTVFIVTRHGQHAQQVVDSVRAGKHVFVEKPLCLTAEQLDEIEQALAEQQQRVLLTVGFNRRFAPATQLVKSFFEPVVGHASSLPDVGHASSLSHGEDASSLSHGEVGHASSLSTSPSTKSVSHGQAGSMSYENRQARSTSYENGQARSTSYASHGVPLTISVRFNAGAIPADHWTQDSAEGGGRIIGEACHAIDLATYLAGSVPVRVWAESVGGTGHVTDDQCFITMRHANGSISNVAYLAGGDKAFPKERVEVFGGGRVAVIDDFRSVTTCAGGRQRTRKLRRQDKGHRAEIEAFAHAISMGTSAPISWAHLRAVTLASILAVRSLREGVAFEVA